jgi:bacteriocin biosynthesis cyclodehydratase domain-containing protein
VRRVAPTARVRPGRPHAPPTLVVLADVDPAAGHPALLDLPHLVARLVDGVGVVGPLVLPGSSPCRRCLDLHRADHDPGWPAVAAGLAGRPGTASPATALATAALAAEQALAALDALAGLGPPPRVVAAELVVDLCRATISSRRWSPHPRCACRAAVRRPSG